MMDPDLVALSEAVAAACRQRRLLVATAESCTGGWAAQVITHTAGSSGWFERGFVTYANEAKRELLGVHLQTLERHGAVSEQTVREMAEGALRHSRAQVAVAVSGIAGPGGGSLDKPVGLVCLAWAVAGGQTVSLTQRYPGGREQVRALAIAAALQGVLDVLA